MSAPSPAPLPNFARAASRRAFLTASALGISAITRVGGAHARAVAANPRTATKSELDGPRTRVALNGRRLIAIGDLHGDFLAMVKSLELAQVIDGNGKWNGGDAVVVQVGDVLDRGDSEIAILRKLRSLAKQAKEAGGDLITMNGNHEIMNVMGDFRYATPGAFEECRRYAEKKRAKENAKEGKGEEASATRGDEDEATAGIRARQQLFKPGGEIAKWLAKQPTVLVVDDGTVFAHAGIDLSHVEYGFERINKEVAMWMEGKTKMPPKQVLESDGVVWTRDYGGKDAGIQYEAQSCRRLASALEAADAKRLVMGHTPKTTGVTSGCKGTVWRVDVGASRGIYGNSAQVIEIIGGKVRVLA
jgi:hypothetical protein